VEADEALADGRNPARHGGEDRTGNVLVAVAVELRGTGSDRVCLGVLPATDRHNPAGVRTSTPARY
jgi:hypothetical protein